MSTWIGGGESAAVGVLRPAGREDLGPADHGRLALGAESALRSCYAVDGLALLLNTLHFLGWALPMLPGLIDNRRCKQLGRIELADCETIEPRLVAAGQAVNLRAPDIPELDIHAVRAALAEQQNSHGWAV